MLGTNIVLSSDRAITSFLKKIKVGDKVKYSKVYWIVTEVKRHFHAVGDYAVRYQGKKVGDEYESVLLIHKIAESTGKPVKSARKSQISERAVTLIINESTIANEVAKANDYIDDLYKILAI